MGPFTTGNIRAIAWNRHSLKGSFTEMLLTIAVVLLFLWVLGMITATTFYGFLHIILILALALFLIRIIESV